MKRRNFLRNMTMASVAAPFALNGMNYQGIAKKLFNFSKSAEDRVLVIVRLNGGNDGLNTVIPLDQYENLLLQRPNVIIPQPNIIQVTQDIGFHPVMTGMNTMFNEGTLTIIQNVGYPEQNRSHFRSMDIWSTGMLDVAETRGWLGRYFDGVYPNYPDGYPNATNPDPFAISMGFEVSTTCQGLMANFSHAVNDPFAAVNLVNTGTVNDGTYYGSHMEYLSILINQTNQYADTINAAANAGSSLSTQYDVNNPLAMQLRNVAKMISGGLKTKVYILNVDGFDTHDSQVSSTNPITGTHADLMKRLSDAVSAFQNDLGLLGISNRVAGFTFSEFGRQIASNASFGTDHGDAAPMFLFGTCINSGIIGPNPVISNAVNAQDAVPMQIDFRDIYASILKDWFEVPESEIQPLFEQTITYYQVLGACNVGLDELVDERDKGIVYPNPALNNATLRFKSQSEWVRIELSDMNGRPIKQIYDSNLAQGVHHIPFELHGLKSGQYFLTVLKQSGKETITLTKID